MREAGPKVVKMDTTLEEAARWCRRSRHGVKEMYLLLSRDLWVKNEEVETGK